MKKPFHLLAAIAGVCLSVAAVGDDGELFPDIRDEKLKSAKALFDARIADAKQTYQTFIQRARERHDKEIEAAWKTLEANVELAEKAATKRGDLNGALEVRRLRERMLKWLDADKLVPKDAAPQPKPQSKDAEKPSDSKLTKLLTSKRWKLHRSPAKWVEFKADGTATSGIHKGILRWIEAEGDVVVIWQKPGDHAAVFNLQPDGKTFAGHWFLGVRNTLR